jgi:hypothetical protein
VGSQPARWARQRRDAKMDRGDCRPSPALTSTPWSMSRCEEASTTENTHATANERASVVLPRIPARLKDSGLLGLPLCVNLQLACEGGEAVVVALAGTMKARTSSPPASALARMGCVRPKAKQAVQQPQPDKGQASQQPTHAPTIAAACGRPLAAILTWRRTLGRTAVSSFTQPHPAQTRIRSSDQQLTERYAWHLGPRALPSGRVAARLRNSAG